MWGFGKRSKTARRNKQTRDYSTARVRRRGRPEVLEPRMLMAADPVHVGLVYLETDYLNEDVDQGADTLPDRFLLSFTGGAPDTELTELSISTDKDSDGLSVGDLIFDTVLGGRGKEGAHPFEVVEIQAADPRASVSAVVEDGSQLLTLSFNHFRAGDTVEFTLDVDEVLRLSPDLDIFNSRLDVIASGQEFQDSILSATFNAPHFETAYGQDIFLNDYGDPAADWGLALPPDVSDAPDSRPNRSAAAVAHTQQTPKPISISGHVFVDNNLDLVKQSSEAPIAGVDLALWRFNADTNQYVSTGFTTVTDDSGHYAFTRDLGLMPGTYRVVESQPNGYFSVGAIPGQVAGVAVGNAESVDVLASINIPLGDTDAVHYDFAEALPASVSGFVFRDDSDDGFRDAGEPGIGDVRVQLIPVNTIATQAPLITRTGDDGSYRFDGLAPGEYRLVEMDQPAPYTDGLNRAGTVNGVTVGAAVNPGDEINGVMLAGGDAGVEYNFGELPLGSISGFVFLPPPGEDCHSVDMGDAIPLAGVQIRLFDAASTLVAETVTGADGRYRFDQLPKGTYRVEEITPAGLIDGDARVGTIDGVTVGMELIDGSLGNVSLPAGRDGVDYDFCEAAPARVSGYVYHDRSNEGQRDSGEEGIAGATVQLRDANGQLVATTQTNDSGYYEFTDLLPGTYTIEEITPAGYLDGLDRAGTVAGAMVGTALNPGDRISQVLLKQGQAGVEYNFGELLPASISGRIHADIDGDCQLDPNEEPLPDVVVQLFNEAGELVAETTTDDAGTYHFEGLRPGRYTVVEQQPAGYLEGGQMAGSTGGVATLLNHIQLIPVSSGQHSTDNNFCEHPPSEISGQVFADQDEDCRFDDGELPLAGVKIELLDADGRVLETTYTNSQGRYAFTGLPKGTYTVRETQPVGYLNGGQKAGSGGGDASQPDLIQQIEIGWGERLVNYDFCELEPSSIAGTVFVDSNEDCRHQPELGERPLANVTVRLHDASGQIIATTTTNANGQYRFINLRPGQYRVSEVQPAGYYHGGQMVGSGGGRVLADDLIGEIMIGPGEDLVRYDFCEVTGSSLSGRVWSDRSMDQTFDADESPLAEVQIDLFDENGQWLRSTRTDADGNYRFDDLAPGVYSVREHQPADHFHGGQLAGSHGGDDSTADRISAIVVPGSVDLILYDFPEVPPARISGYVFQDGPTIERETPPAPETLREFRDGQLTPDDTRLAGVTLELRNLFGTAFDESVALPGMYPEGPIRVTTDANGYYEFSGLLPRTTYHVYQVQPNGFIDGLDTAGQAVGSLAVNVADIDTSPQLQILISTLTLSPETDPGSDAILRILVDAGDHARFNNFSEIRVEPPTIGRPPEDPETPTFERPNVPLETFPDPAKLFAAAPPNDPSLIPRYRAIAPVTWHLSIINGGQPRGTGIDASSIVIPAAGDQIMQRWNTKEANRGQWRLFDAQGNPVDFGRVSQIGTHTGKPLVGDFDGDGRDEAAIYNEGEWLVDLNGNGRWDPGDLWVMLGSAMDRPVVGDWDGDGKDDVGIFGPEWHRDPVAIRRDPGLPDPDNQRRRGQKNQPPIPEDATSGKRWLRKTPQGRVRADVIDHVFRYGEGSDVPLVGDWNGDGVDAIAVYLDGVWKLDSDADGRWTDADVKAVFGQPGDIPIVGDWNGDGIDEIAVVRGDTWIIDVDGDRRLTGADLQIRIPGGEGAIPVMGDWDGDGRDEPGWYRYREDDGASDAAA